MAPFIESVSNKPGPAKLAPIGSLFLLSAALPKVRVAGRLLAVDGTTGWLLLASRDARSGVWVDPAVVAEGAEGGFTGALAKEGTGSCWMATGDLEQVQVLPPLPADLPLDLSTLLEPTPDRVLRAVLLRPVDDSPPGAGAFDLPKWEQAAHNKFKEDVQ